jgi:hypothetical protein
MACTCFIVPREVLIRFSHDKELSAEVRKRLFDTAQISHEIRELRVQAGKLTNVSMAHAGAFPELAASPLVTVYNCNHTQTTAWHTGSEPGEFLRHDSEAHLQGNN